MIAEQSLAGFGEAEIGARGLHKHALGGAVNGGLTRAQPPGAACRDQRQQQQNPAATQQNIDVFQQVHAVPRCGATAAIVPEARAMASVRRRRRPG